MEDTTSQETPQSEPAAPQDGAAEQTSQTPTEPVAEDRAEETTPTKKKPKQQHARQMEQQARTKVQRQLEGLEGQISAIQELLSSQLSPSASEAAQQLEIQGVMALDEKRLADDGADPALIELVKLNKQLIGKIGELDTRTGQLAPYVSQSRDARLQQEFTATYGETVTYAEASKAAAPAVKRFIDSDPATQADLFTRMALQIAGQGLSAQQETETDADTPEADTDQPSPDGDHDQPDTRITQGGVRLDRGNVKDEHAGQPALRGAARVVAQALAAGKFPVSGE